ncbi:MAG: 3'-5' exonuclease [Verrucomicrobiaceae bacterium]|nr:3'-5' exonuclease [Verrucomicrobiaceae bacterium]
MDFAAIDFESTGHLEDRGDEPIQIGIALMQGVDITPDHFFRSFIQPDQPRAISHAARAVHRIKDDDLQGAPLLVNLWPTIRNALKARVVVAHGAGTEKRFLRAFPIHGFGPWVDTLQLARKYLPTLNDYSLGALLQNLNLEEEVTALCPGLSWHDALFDAVASLILLRRILKESASVDDPGALLGIS